jgi:hypothetical protein
MYQYTYLSHIPSKDQALGVHFVSLDLGMHALSPGPVKKRGGVLTFLLSLDKSTFVYLCFLFHFYTRLSF